MERKIHWRYVLLGLGLAFLAGLRLNEGSPVWATVFAAAALGNAYLSIRSMLPPRFGGEVGPREWQTHAAKPAAAAPLPEEMRRSLGSYDSRAKSWLVILVAATVVAGSLLVLVPPAGLVAAAVPLFATFRYLRYRRSVRILRRALPEPADEGSTMSQRDKE